MKRVCVYCASSKSCDSTYHAAAHRLGQTLARASLTVVYGGGAQGSMGALADGALAEGGQVVGVLPRFMAELEWGHPRVSELELVDDMHSRKRRMLSESDAVIALPGGSGTLEELFEAITFKRLGLYFGPIVMVNTRGFFDPCIELLERSIAERFMANEHAKLWCVVTDPEEVVGAIRDCPTWPRNARSFATL